MEAVIKRVITAEFRKESVKLVTQQGCRRQICGRKFRGMGG